uniref:Uncharacterized protein n=1 Tax=Parascaris univalens TaxID=6257 RepID=A0A915CCI8_PARUN
MFNVMKQGYDGSPTQLIYIAINSINSSRDEVSNKTPIFPYTTKFDKKNHKTLYTIVKQSRSIS